MAKKLSKAEKKELIQKAEEARAKHPQPKSAVSGFETIDKEAEKLSGRN
ncbi:hypothetical protein MK904_03570 [Loigolactobacillus coryniformis]|jgi:hypothetical protein|nr:hypothetical protein [Loigolactobacillus coryniformis]MBW4803008.1 hypothetical protein [Loigolactobacillus coryniformis subsp. torquens]MBW4805704.1 hypothetical protein [Loigolactobacillus coryniformis subsp. torquens]MCL5457762.1 hypothetical protein [Loigolactobacillus coryniformis]MDC4185180.1 hypothetical protein [Loigolactobacillus coryniformis]MDN5953536.1 hypothetical protein [Loigolactobacillus coryniformis]